MTAPEPDAKGRGTPSADGRTTVRLWRPEPLSLQDQRPLAGRVGASTCRGCAPSPSPCPCALWMHCARTPPRRHPALSAEPPTCPTKSVTQQRGDSAPKDGSGGLLAGHYGKQGRKPKTRSERSITLHKTHVYFKKNLFRKSGKRNKYLYRGRPSRTQTESASRRKARERKRLVNKVRGRGAGESALHARHHEPLSTSSRPFPRGLLSSGGLPGVTTAFSAPPRRCSLLESLSLSEVGATSTWEQASSAVTWCCRDREGRGRTATPRRQPRGHCVKNNTENHRHLESQRPPEHRHSGKQFTATLSLTAGQKGRLALAPSGLGVASVKTLTPMG